MKNRATLSALWIFSEFTKIDYQRTCAVSAISQSISKSAVRSDQCQSLTCYKGRGFAFQIWGSVALRMNDGSGTHATCSPSLGVNTHLLPIHWAMTSKSLGTKTYFVLIWLSTPNFLICNEKILMWLKCIFIAFINVYFASLVLV